MQGDGGETGLNRNIGRQVCTIHRLCAAEWQNHHVPGKLIAIGRIRCSAGPGMTNRSFIASAAAAVAALGVPLLSAAAAEFCVSCDGPAAQYACSIDGAAALSGDPRLKLYCMTELAKSGGHASCSIDRAQPKPCGGIAKVLGAPEGLELAKPQAPAPAGIAPPEAEAAPPDDATAAKPNPAAPAPAQAPQPDAQETTVAKTPVPPKTVKEMVDKSSEQTAESLEKTGEAASSAAKSAGTALEKAGQAIGDAAKKTWTCVTSLFGDC